MFFLGLLITIVLTFWVGLWLFISCGEMNNGNDGEKKHGALGLVGSFLLFLGGGGIAMSFFSENFNNIVFCLVCFLIATTIFIFYIIYMSKK